MSRSAEPLDPEPLSAFHDACIEEIHQGNEHWGVLCLLDLHTGLRKTVCAHYVDDWRTDGTGGEKLTLPKGAVECTLEPDGCCECNSNTSGAHGRPDGYFGVKKNTAGEGRTVPIPDEFMDYHRDESRPTDLPKWLDHYFTANNSFGMTASQLGRVVKHVASRRYDTIADNHEGEVERWLSDKKREVPDIQFHDLRATWATQCLRTGVEARQLMDWAGWGTMEMIEHYRQKLDDPSGRNRDSYRSGREGEGLSAQEKLTQLRELGLIDDDENLSADELAEVVKLLD
jgi:hypothetical protein